MSQTLPGAQELGWEFFCRGSSRKPWLVTLALWVIGLIALYGPTYWRLSETVWADDEQGHGPIILAVSIWLLAGKVRAFKFQENDSSSASAWPMLALALLMYVLGRSQSIWFLEVGSQIPLLAALALLLGGARLLRTVWFPVAFLTFMVPLPEALVAALTAPLKQAVAASASGILYNLGYPVGRSGVILTIAQFQLFVADACAGLNSIFTLEALGLLYMHIVGHKSPSRNLLLAALLVPISFCANVVRVVALVLVTFYFGDAAAQGFTHAFAGLLLFAVALCLMLAVDNLISSFAAKGKGA